jgi:hypothetical protein
LSSPADRCEMTPSNRAFRFKILASSCKEQGECQGCAMAVR